MRVVRRLVVELAFRHCQVMRLMMRAARQQADKAEPAYMLRLLRVRRGDGQYAFRTKERKPASEQSCRPSLRQQRCRHARAEPAARRERRIVRSDERRHAERVHRSLRIYLGYDERGGEQNYLGVKPHPL